MGNSQDARGEGEKGEVGRDHGGGVGKEGRGRGWVSIRASKKGEPLIPQSSFLRDRVVETNFGETKTLWR